jgi:hypothetical protein
VRGRLAVSPLFTVTEIGLGLMVTPAHGTAKRSGKITARKREIGVLGEGLLREKNLSIIARLLLKFNMNGDRELLLTTQEYCKKIVK